MIADVIGPSLECLIKKGLYTARFRWTPLSNSDIDYARPTQLYDRVLVRTVFYKSESEHKYFHQSSIL